MEIEGEEGGGEGMVGEGVTSERGNGTQVEEV